MSAIRIARPGIAGVTLIDLGPIDMREHRSPVFSGSLCRPVTGKPDHKEADRIRRAKQRAERPPRPLPERCAATMTGGKLCGRREGHRGWHQNVDAVTRENNRKAAARYRLRHGMAA